MKNEFIESIDRAVNNSNLTGALGKFSEAYRVNRAKAYEGVDFDELREKIASIKSAAALELDALAELFRENAEARGAKVFRTDEPVEVKEYILRIARENGVKTIVKSKSMATEEIHLNPFLEKAGIVVKETDLGEWIIQLAGQTPSHMVMPAIHMTREEVSDIFSKEVNERLSSDIPKLVKVAREQLRPFFLNADMGISGANIAVAETGTLVLMTNEGNARLVTTLPRIHVAVVGIEKLVRHFKDIVPIIKALPRSATAQLLTSYVSIITGKTPVTNGNEKELHIILMDNHRSDMAADPVFRQAMQCIRCASCLNVCPVFRLVGGHVFGKVYTGGIGTILTAWFDELGKSSDIQGLCIQCGACKDVCPAKIGIPELIMEIRRRLVTKQGLPLVQKALYSVVNNRRLFHSMLRAASIAGGAFASGGFIRHLPFFLSELTDGRSLPAIAKEPFRDRFTRIRQPVCREKAVFYAGCLIDFAYPEMGEAVVKILNSAGIEVIFPEGQTCCGAPAKYAGAYEVAAANAVDNIKALLLPDVSYVVSACPTCTVALQRDFLKTLEAAGKNKWITKAEELAAKSFDFSSLAKKLAESGRLSFSATDTEACVTYHDSCHLKRSLCIHEEPRTLLNLAGYTIQEMSECDTCCGMGGAYSMKLPEISLPMLKRKLANIDNTKAGTAAMDCPGCVLQIRGGFDRERKNITVKHSVELLAERLKE